MLFRKLAEILGALRRGFGKLRPRHLAWAAAVITLVTAVVRFITAVSGMAG